MDYGDVHDGVLAFNTFRTEEKIQITRVRLEGKKNAFFLFLKIKLKKKKKKDLMGTCKYFMRKLLKAFPSEINQPITYSFLKAMMGCLIFISTVM